MSDNRSKLYMNTIGKLEKVDYARDNKKVTYSYKDGTNEIFEGFNVELNNPNSDFDLGLFAVNDNGNLEIKYKNISIVKGIKRNLSNLIECTIKNNNIYLIKINDDNKLELYVNGKLKVNDLEKHLYIKITDNSYQILKGSIVMGEKKGIEILDVDENGKPIYKINIDFLSTDYSNEVFKQEESINEYIVYNNGIENIGFLNKQYSNKFFINKNNDIVGLKFNKHNTGKFYIGISIKGYTRNWIKLDHGIVYKNNINLHKIGDEFYISLMNKDGQINIYNSKGKNEFDFNIGPENIDKKIDYLTKDDKGKFIFLIKSSNGDKIFQNDNIIYEGFLGLGKGDHIIKNNKKCYVISTENFEIKLNSSKISKKKKNSFKIK